MSDEKVPSPLAVAATVALGGCSTLLLRSAWPTTSGMLSGLPVLARVEIVRDAYGIPHITAANEHDLYVAQGFVHAQDRLWQMELLRRLTEGRLSEVAGERMVAVDYFARMVGMPSLKSAAATCPWSSAWKGDSGADPRVRAREHYGRVLATNGLEP